MTFLLVSGQSYHCSVNHNKSPRPQPPLVAPQPPPRLADVHDAIVNCERCPRLRSYCRRVAAEKRAAYRAWTYWGRPVPGFGDPQARVLILGLAPAAHGANRTGRVFTGDGVGASGDFLFAALHRASRSNRDNSQTADDGLMLRDVYIAAAVRCAPPDNKPTPEEVTTCLSHLEAELALLPNLDTVVALGKIAWDAWFQLLARHGARLRPKPAFGHGAVVSLAAVAAACGDNGAPALRIPPRLIGCYHPSRQNTSTGTVTAAMYDDVFSGLLGPPPAVPPGSTSTSVDPGCPPTSRRPPASRSARP
jgi:uracil-DNA glycosylase family 4